MTVKLGSESSYGRTGHGFGQPFQKSYFGFAPADTWTPNVNLYESDRCYLVCVDLAGVEKGEIDVVVHSQRLKLTGRRAAPTRDTPTRDTPNRDSADPCATRLRVHLMEIDHGQFSREVELPADVDQTRIAATFENGLLWIELPKS